VTTWKASQENTQTNEKTKMTKERVEILFRVVVEVDDDPTTPNIASVLNRIDYHMQSCEAFRHEIPETTSAELYSFRPLAPSAIGSAEEGWCNRCYCEKCFKKMSEVTP